MKRIKVLDTQITSLTMDEALEKTEELIISGRGGRIFTPNANIIEYADKNKDFLKILNSASLSLCDGIGVSIGAFLLGCGRVRRICGVDFGFALAELCAKKGYTLYLLGGKEGVALEAARSLTKRFPSLKIAGTHDGYFEDEIEVLSEISLSGAQVLYVCLGSPKQEEFIYNNQKYLSDTLMVGLGGSIDIYSGKVRRAPKLLRKLGFEWLYRIVTEPSRLKKAKMFSFAMSVLKKRFFVKNADKSAKIFLKKG